VMWCYKCAHGIFHFFHDDGTEVEGKLKADPRCVKCSLGEEHTTHDRKAFNQDDYLRS